ERHAGRDLALIAWLDRRVEPFIIAREMAGIERRAQAASCQRFGDGGKNSATRNADIGGLIPGEEALEIGRGDFEKFIVMLDEKPAARGQSAPQADRTDNAIAMPEYACTRAPETHDRRRCITARQHQMGIEGLTL